DGLAAAARTVGLTPSQLIIEASLAQAEGGSVSDYPKIAEVIHNRIAKGMHLQFDSTVLYGLGKYAVSATIRQTRTPGPYNTYANAGLPVGPISNPGQAAIQGILHPAHGDWLYFLTVPDGKSQFSASPLKGQ
ncbi:MAG TPA: endolytic transglycosylase MltG, partial [Trebonia sp.]